MSSKLLSERCFAEEIVTRFFFFVPALLAPVLTERSASTAAIQLFRRCSRWQTRLHSCLTPTSRGVSAGKHMRVCVVRARRSECWRTRLPRARGAQMPCSPLTFPV